MLDFNKINLKNILVAKKLKYRILGYFILLTVFCFVIGYLNRNMFVDNPVINENKSLFIAIMSLSTFLMLCFFEIFKKGKYYNILTMIVMYFPLVIPNLIFEKYSNSDFIEDMLGKNGYEFYCDNVDEDQPVKYYFIDNSFVITGEDFVFEMEPSYYVKFYRYKISKPKIVGNVIQTQTVSDDFKRNIYDLEEIKNSPKGQFILSLNQE